MPKVPAGSRTLANLWQAACLRNPHESAGNHPQPDPGGRGGLPLARRAAECDGPFAETLVQLGPASFAVARTTAREPWPIRRLAPQETAQSTPRFAGGIRQAL